MNESTSIEVERRVAIIAKFIIQGLRTGEIKEKIHLYDSYSDEYKLKHKIKWSPWNVIDRQIDTYIARAKEEISICQEGDINKLIAEMDAQFLFLFRKAIERGQINTANNVMRNRMYLRGVGRLNLKQKIDYTKLDIPLSEDEQREYDKLIDDFIHGDIDLINGPKAPPDDQ